MDWNREKCLVLLDEYEKCPELWDPQHGAYYNKEKKNQAWEDIAKTLNFAPEECKRKLESMLASFRREKAKYKQSLKSKGQRKVYQSRWFAFKRMSFLLNRGKSKQVADDPIEIKIEAGEPELLEETYVTEKDFPLPTQQDTFDEGTMNSPTADPLENTTHRAEKRKRAQQEEPPGDPRIDESLKPAATNLAGARSVEESTDPPGVFGQYVASKLRGYSKRVRAVVEYNINNILFQADIGHFDNNINPASAATLLASTSQDATTPSNIQPSSAMTISTSTESTQPQTEFYFKP